MHSKILIGILILLGQSSILKAQFENRSSELFFHYGLVESLQLNEWKYFVTSYNTAVTPTKNLGDFEQGFNFDVGYRLNLNRFYSTLSYQRYYGKASAEFANNESRLFDLHANAVAWGFGYKMRTAEKKFNLSLVYNMRITGKTRIVSSYKYTDGFESMGGEKSLNGTYFGVGALGSELGFLVQYGISKKIKIEIGLIKQWNNSLTPSTMDDKSDYKAFKGTGGSELPQDYVSYSADPSQYILDSKLVVHDKSNGNKIMIGISYSISNTN